ncbi:MAG: CDC48 family AAA ATPase [Sandaracinaceae bacterium]|nr:MAG: AAA family ATPase [Sandaracinaceae bacterium]
MAKDEVVLQVAAATNQDMGKGVARLSKSAMEALELRGGEVVEIEGKRRSAALALPPYEEDAGLDIIRLDGLERHNAGVGISDRVAVRKAEAKPARKVVLAPAQDNVRLSGPGEALKPTLIGRPLAPGSVISTSVYRRAPGMNGGPFPHDVMNALYAQRAYGLQEIRLVVVSGNPSGIVRVTPETEIELRAEHTEPEERVLDVTYDDVGGISHTLDEVREMIELPLKHPELFQRLGIDPPKGVLLYGPPGTGKTLLARAVANESDAHFISVAGPEIMGKLVGESEERLRQIFEEAEQNAPSIVFFDEIDSIAPKRDEVTGEGEKRLVAQLLTLMDGLKPRQNVVVIGATNRPDAIDEALRRPGRFDRELTIGVPDKDGRREVLQIHTRGMPLGDDVELDRLAQMTYGFVGADLAALCREAALESLRRVLPSIDLEADEIPEEALEQLIVLGSDFDAAIRRVQPTALREIMIQTPNVSWDDVGGLDEAKESLREGIELPLKRPDAFERMGIRPAKGFLLYGPPGTGKTLLAKACAREAEANFISMRSSDLLSKWYGESEKQVARLFQRARQVAPTVIFLDEIDSLAPRRGGGLGEPAVTERVVNTILAEMDGLEELKGVVLVGATNQPTLIDPALLRPGRFDELIYVPVPNERGRLKILKIHTQGMPLAAGVDLASLAKRTEGYTGADLEDLVRRAGLIALRHDLEVSDVPMPIFEEALKHTRASVTEEMDAAYRKMAEDLQRERPAEAKRIGF